MYKINLLPVELQRDISIDVKGLVRRVSITVTVILLLASYGVFLFMGYLTQKEIADTERYLNQISPAVKKVEAIKAQRAKDEQSIKVYKEILSARLTRYPLLEDLNSNMPVDMWLETLDLSYVERKDAGSNPQEQPAAAAQPKGQAAGGKNGKVSIPLPNTLVLEGYARQVPSIGFFTNYLYRMPYFSKVVLDSYEWNEDKFAYKFKLTAALKEGDR